MARRDNLGSGGAVAPARKPRFGAGQKTKGGVLKRAKRRLRKLDIGEGRLASKNLLQGGISGAEARRIKQDYKATLGSKGYTPKGKRGKQAVFKRPQERVQGETTNTVATGAGSQRRGGKFTVRLDPNKRRFVHVYKSGQSVTDSKRKEVVIRKDNPLTKEYTAKRRRKNEEKLNG